MDKAKIKAGQNALSSCHLSKLRAEMQVDPLPAHPFDWDYRSRGHIHPSPLAFFWTLALSLYFHNVHTYNKAIYCHLARKTLAHSLTRCPLKKFKNLSGFRSLRRSNSTASADGRSGYSFVLARLLDPLSYRSVYFDANYPAPCLRIICQTESMSILSPPRASANSTIDRRYS